ncbi:hypothetical protein QTJ16_003358 [Diplocarpon rosae]|uniref:Uncharacterized protein n=1 Tax=Diplocarpon rosae TaxID=946125 RepID=A0AAD9WDB8_9HELO|nr:hypothetical protein QTJ16_003358 [Diplocarpon rosae]PBP17154.1 hypothetical protein BUE80_DR012067 [Diplocarpon rosae]
MPHKHTRKGVVDKATVDLPPTTIAKPLSTSKASTSNGIFTKDLSNTAKRTNKKRKRKDTDDDTPKAFARLMAFTQGKKLPKGLDDGVRESKAEKKRKITKQMESEDRGGEDTVPIAKGRPETDTGLITIRLGEKMSEFSARVDAALPVSGLINKSVRSGKDPLGLKVGRTKTEKRMHRMYDEWRAEEARIQEQREEALEQAEEAELEEGEDGQVHWRERDQGVSGGGGKGVNGKNKKKKKKRGKLIGELDDGEEDPWVRVSRDRGETKAAFGDVVQAPPVFTKAPREKFKIRGAMVEVGDVPRASGSLRRREELGGVRREVVEGYRRLMAGKKLDTTAGDEA